jgi:hypothetical protein
MSSLQFSPALFTSRIEQAHTLKSTRLLWIVRDKNLKK